MARSKPLRRMKYGKHNTLVNPVGWVLEGFMKAVDHPSDVLGRACMASHSAMTELVAGRGNRQHLGDIAAMWNMTRALLLDGFGADLFDIVLTADKAIRSLAERSLRTGGYVATGPEIKALNALLELHDAQLEVAAVGDIGRAKARTDREFAGGKFYQIPKEKT